MKWPEQLQFITLTPQIPLATLHSRSVLPEKIALEDAVFNIQRVSLLLRSLQTEDFSLLREALADRLHQPCRTRWSLRSSALWRWSIPIFSASA